MATLLVALWMILQAVAGLLAGTDHSSSDSLDRSNSSCTCAGRTTAVAHLLVSADRLSATIGTIASRLAAVALLAVFANNCSL